MSATNIRVDIQQVTAGAAGALEMANDRALTAAVVASLVLNGDISGLNPVQKAVYYVERCRQLGLDPRSKPFQVLKLNGKEILYADKGAADQLAKIHNVNRRITDGPKVIKLGGRDVVFCQCEASLPNGRCEMDVATLPAGDFDNVLMKVTTKVKRRATLALLGLGMLDESELSTIPAAAIGEHVGVDLSLAGVTVEARQLAEGHPGNTPDPSGTEPEAVAVPSFVDLAAVTRWYATVDLGADGSVMAGKIRDRIAADLRGMGYRLGASDLNSVLKGSLYTTLVTLHDRCAAEGLTYGVLRVARDMAAEIERITDPRGRDACVTVLARYFGDRSDPRLEGNAARAAYLRALATPPDGGPSGTRTPAAPSSADATAAPLPSTAANDAAAQASAGPRVVLDADETEARYLRADSVGAEAWAAHLAACAAIFAMAGSHTKRAEAFRAAGVLATRRAQTLDAIEAREGRGPEAAAQALDGYRTRRVVPIGQSVRARTAAEIRAAQTAQATARGAA